MASKFQLLLFRLPFPHLLLEYLSCLSSGAALSTWRASCGARCVCLAVLISSIAHRLWLALIHGHHSHPHGSGILGCYQHDDKQQEWAPGQQLLCGKVMWWHLAPSCLSVPATSFHQSSSPGRLWRVIDANERVTRMIQSLTEENLKNI